MRLFLALPAYNEAESLPHLFAAFEREVVARDVPARVVVVDDGSTDATMDVVREWSGRLDIEALRHRGNCGLGTTIRDALWMAAKSAEPADVIVTMDADNTHSPALILTMLERLQAGHDIVIASRYRTGAGVVGLSPLRLFMSTGARFLFQTMYPIPGVRDYTCGFRAYRAGLIQRGFEKFGDSLITETGFACMAEVLLKLTKLDARMCEVPMVLRYDHKRGTSKMRVWRTVNRTVRLLLRARFERWH